MRRRRAGAAQPSIVQQLKRRGADISCFRCRWNSLFSLRCRSITKEENIDVYLSDRTVITEVSEPKELFISRLIT